MPIPIEAMHIARDKKSGMHSLVRFVPNEVLDAPLAEVGVDRANAFLMARGPESLVESAIQLGPMFASRADLNDRVLTFTDAMGEKGKRLLQSDSSRLLAECFFDPYVSNAGGDGLMFEVTGRVPRASADRTVEEFDFCGNSPAYDYLGDHFTALIEPVQDWVLLRNLLSITLRLGGTLRKNPSGETVLEDAGFSKVGRKTLQSKFALDAPGYAIPVMYNPYFRDGNLLKNGLVFDGNATRPLYERIARVETRRRAGLILVDVGVLKGNGSIKFVTGAQAEAAGGSSEQRGLLPEERKWLYLVVEDGIGLGQKELADMLLDSLDQQLYRPRLSYSGDSMEGVSISAYDLPSALWALVRNHPNHYLMTCDNCHRTVFSTMQGPNRRFCSDSCRVTWNKRH